jgi:hypothetical protein
LGFPHRIPVFAAPAMRGEAWNFQPMPTRSIAVATARTPGALVIEPQLDLA